MAIVEMLGSLGDQVLHLARDTVVGQAGMVIALGFGLYRFNVVNARTLRQANARRENSQRLAANETLFGSVQLGDNTTATTVSAAVRLQAGRYELVLARTAADGAHSCEARQFDSIAGVEQHLAANSPLRLRDLKPRAAA